MATVTVMYNSALVGNFRVHKLVHTHYLKISSVVQGRGVQD
jgi:hypothetical protein